MDTHTQVHLRKKVWASAYDQYDQFTMEKKWKIIYFCHVKLFYYTQDPKIDSLDLFQRPRRTVRLFSSHRWCDIHFQSQSICGAKIQVKALEVKTWPEFVQHCSPKCPGLASASLCIRESRVRGDIGKRSLVFPEFVLENRNENIL